MDAHNDLFDLDTTVVNAEVVDGQGSMGLMGLPAGSTALQVRGSYSTAVSVAVPRDIVRIERSLLAEARSMGESAFYGWGEGKDRIEGKSTNLAHALARNWGNCAVEMGPVQDLPDAWVFNAYFVDLETGFTLARPFRQDKNWVVHGKFDAQRKNDIRFQIGVSKAIRNVILNALPKWMADKALAEAKKGMREKLEKFIAAKGIAAAQALVLGELKKHGVLEEAVLRKFGIASVAALDVDRLVSLRGTLQALQDGEIRAADAFPVPPLPNGGSTLDAFANGAGAPAAETPAATGPQTINLETDLRQPAERQRDSPPKADPDEPSRPELTDAFIAVLRASLAEAGVAEGTLAKAIDPVPGVTQFRGPKGALSLDAVQGEPGEAAADLEARANAELEKLLAPKGGNGKLDFEKKKP